MSQDTEVSTSHQHETLLTSGEGGVILLERAKEVINTEFPEIAKKVTLNIPDEKARRVGQSVAAASLPKIN